MRKTSHKVYFADSRTMREISNESVHLVVTSPPYWQLKDYGNNCQIGFNDSYEDYINNLNLVWKECYRVLHQGCRLCINIGDQFARAVYYGRYKVIPIRTEIIKFCETIGFDYMGAIIWQKVTTCNTTGGATIMGSYPYPRNGIVKIDYEFILLFKKPGNTPSAQADAKESSILTIDEWNEYFAGHWNFAGEKQDGHIAMFPEELPKRLIKMFSFVGETVLDPFLGSGTTSLAAKNLSRNSIGYEINQDFQQIIHKKVSSESELFDESNLSLIVPERDSSDFKAEIQQLPYVFSDSVKFNKKVNPSDLSFGSRISMAQEIADNGRAVRVAKVLSVNTLQTNAGLTIRLLGIREMEGFECEARKWLSDMLVGQKIELQFDEEKHDEHGNLLAYVYLANKTFINMHYIRTGLVDVDLSIPFKHVSKFSKSIPLNRSIYENKD